MPEDKATIEARVRAANPEVTAFRANRQTRERGHVVLTEQDREDWIATAVDLEQARQIADETETAKRTRREQFIAGVATLRDDVKTLKGPPAPTAVQVRDATLHCAQALLWLADVLKDANIAGPDDNGL